MNAEDAKLITLARGARGRVGAHAGAAVRDDTGRSYSGADVVLPSLSLTALQLAVAAAVAAGARGIEGAAIVSVSPEASRHELAALREAGGAGITVLLADPSGTVVGNESV
ncbi:MAG: cytidine deaminase [Actinobacteria bacterium]|nr:cytidine deaminase [Actinomycetota bacterium]MCB9413295.1 cytidine deaminase [Actinomycetota bacterium]